MHVNSLFVLSLLSASGSLLVDAKQAPKIKKNPQNVVAIADFPFGYDKNVKGNIVFTANKGGQVNVHVDMTGLPPSGGPFYYHIHENEVPENGDCSKVGGHFNPYKGSMDCDNQKDDSYCQVGDLSGKHGWIDTTCFETKYDDPYLSLNKKSKSYIVGRSIAFHFANMTRFACADIQFASELRLDSLQQEYEASNNNDLVQLKADLVQSYEFDEDEAVKEEVFEEANDKSKSGVQFSKLPEKFNKTNQLNYTSSYNGTDIDYHSNHTNVTTSYYTSDYENGSAMKSLGFGAGIAGLLGMLI